VAIAGAVVGDGKIEKSG